MFRIFLSSLNEILLRVLKLERFLEVLHRVAVVEAVLAGVDIDTDESSRWEGMDADVALGDNHEAAPTARILGIVSRRFKDYWRCQLRHAEILWQFIQAAKNHLPII